MSKKTLNHANLASLGAERLADLLIEVSTGSAEIKRRLRLELSHNLGPAELARDVRKRLASIRRSTSFVGWRRRKALIKDLTTQAGMITNKIAPDAPDEGFDLLWEFLQMAPSVYARVDDSRGDVGDVFRTARARFSDIAPHTTQDPEELAARTWDALQDNGYGEFDGIIALLAPALGDAGLARLKSLVLAHKETPVAEGETHAALQFLRDLRSTSGSFAADQKDRLIKSCLQQIAALEGDTDSFIAQYSDRDLSRPHIAAHVANLLLREGRAEQALEVLEAANPDMSDRAWDDAYIACLLALDRADAAQAYRWTCFCETLDAGMLRDHLKHLPDFEDIDVEDRAKEHALQFSPALTALHFFLNWPDLHCAARLTEARIDALDGDRYDVLAPAADNLRDKYPLAAVLLWRAMIEAALVEGRTSRYAAAADYLMDCTAADLDIVEYGPFAPHHIYLEDLRARHKHKSSFWARIA